MEEDAVWPYVREDRIDLDLVPALVLSVSTAVSTVVATKLSDGVIKSISRAVRSWLTKRKADDETTLQVQETGVALVIDANTTDEEITTFILRARDGRPQKS